MVVQNAEAVLKSYIYINYSKLRILAPRHLHIIISFYEQLLNAMYTRIVECVHQLFAANIKQQLNTSNVYSIQFSLKTYVFKNLGDIIIRDQLFRERIVLQQQITENCNINIERGRYTSGMLIRDQKKLADAQIYGGGFYYNDNQINK